MASYDPRNINDQHETDEIDDGTSSAYASIREYASITSDETMSLTNSYLSVKGSQSESYDTQSQISSGYQFPKRHGKSDTRSFSSSTTYTAISLTSDVDTENEQYHIAEINKGITEPRKGKEMQCFNCRKKVATHFCKNCKEGRKYICHVCLRDHNNWTDDHSIVSLSVDSERNALLQAEDRKLANVSPQLPPTIRKKHDLTEHIKEKMVSPEDMTILVKEKSDSERTAKYPGKIPGTKFYKDSLLLNIARDRQIKKQQRKDEGKLVKYGTYSIRTPSDKKPCVIVGISQLENKRILFADSENSELKVMDNESFRVIASHELPNNPYLMCYVEGNKVIVAFINFQLRQVDLSDGMNMKSMFEIKHHFKSIAYANNEIFGCTVDTIEIYSENGQQKSKSKPHGITAIEDMCLNKRGDLVYCADAMKGIVILDRRGNVTDFISENIYTPHRLCIGLTGELFVTEKDSERLIKVHVEEKNAKKVGLENVFIKNNPISLGLDTGNNRLIVALWQSDKLHVYNCP